MVSRAFWMWFQPCASLLRSRNVFLSSTTFVDETRGVAYSIQNLRFVTSTSFLYISLTVHLVIILCLWPTRSTFLYLYLLHLSNVSSTRVLIIRRSNCVNTSSGMIGLCERLLGMTGIPSSHSQRLIIPFIHSVFCLMTGPKPPLKWFLELPPSNESILSFA